MYTLLIISGASAIGTQVVWLRYFSIILGNNIQSFSWVSSTFMVGLSLGAFLATKLFTKSRKNLIKKYIIIEFSFLLAVVLSFIAIYYYQNDLIVFLTPQSIFKDGLIVIATLLPASILMGMSLPILIDFDKNFHKHERMV
ncbi:MAG: hypothetical protein MK008_13745 [Bdellovibrionales bacterium]|nr:hypothetical protein [Bdellovibrionales bacterium]